METLKIADARDKEQVEAPKVKRKKSGRRPRKTYEGLEKSIKVTSIKESLQEEEVLKITYKSANKNELLEFIAR